MAELGPGAAAFHREVGAAAAGAGVSELVAVGPLAREYGAGAPGVRLHAVGTAAEAVERLRGLLRPGDVVLVKGSRSVGLEAVAANLGGMHAPSPPARTAAPPTAGREPS